jgi:hypothetical protein
MVLGCLTGDKGGRILSVELVARQAKQRRRGCLVISKWVQDLFLADDLEALGCEGIPSFIRSAEGHGDVEKIRSDMRSALLRYGPDYLLAYPEDEEWLGRILDVLEGRSHAYAEQP